MNKAAKQQPARGRPPIADDERMIVVPVRLTQAQKDKLARIGGAARLREWLDRVKDA